MIFDDHDVVDDWNTSAAWLADMRATNWWRERLLSGLMSYWVYQQLGNLSPAELAADPLYAAVRATPDGTDALRTFAAKADADFSAVRWSYRRDFGRVRLLMVDTRAARVLAEDRRAMLDPGEALWLRDQMLDGRDGEGPGAYDHLLIGSSLPWLLPHLVHDVEGWNAALCAGERGTRWARFGEKLRRAADLEHWAAFPSSFGALADMIAEVASGRGRRPRCASCPGTCTTRTSPSRPGGRDGDRGPGGAADLFARPQLGAALHPPGLPVRLERPGARPGPALRPARAAAAADGALAQAGRPLVRQPADDADPARALGPAAPGPGRGDGRRTGAAGGEGDAAVLLSRRRGRPVRPPGRTGLPLRAPQVPHRRLRDFSQAPQRRLTGIPQG